MASSFWRHHRGGRACCGGTEYGGSKTGKPSCEQGEGERGSDRRREIRDDKDGKPDEFPRAKVNSRRSIVMQMFPGQ
jgi:hypothetical protein